jgi:hypothetical protein
MKVFLNFNIHQNFNINFFDSRLNKNHVILILAKYLSMIPFNLKIVCYIGETLRNIRIKWRSQMFEAKLSAYAYAENLAAPRCS